FPVIWPFGSLKSAVSKNIIRLFREASYAPEIYAEAHSASEALGCVQERLGITFIRASDLHLRAKGVRFCLVADQTIQLETGIVWIGEQKSKVLTSLLCVMAKAFRGSHSVGESEPPTSERKPNGRSVRIERAWLKAASH